MKYLVLEQSRFSADYQVREFSTPEELSEYVMRTGTSKVILAQRIALAVTICDWSESTKELKDAA